MTNLIKRKRRKNGGRGKETLMSASRICLVVAAALALSACAARRPNRLPDPPLTNASPVPTPASRAAAPATPQPAPPAAPRSSATTPAAKAPVPNAIKVAPPVVRTPAPVARSPQPPAPVAASPALDLNTLTKQLKETKAIGLFSKIALKNKVDDLLDEFRKYYQGNTKINLTELRQSFNLLMMKLLSLLQDEDKTLASKIVSSREAIWDFLTDPKKFATLET